MIGNLDDDRVIYGTMIFLDLGGNDKDLELMQSKCPAFLWDA
jgi:hypothetical protein